MEDGFRSISVTHDGPAGSLNTGGWIEDNNVGFSTTMTFADPGDKSTNLMGTQIIVGAAGAALSVPGEFVISSRLVMRKMGDQPVNVHGDLTFSDKGVLAKASISMVHIAAGEVKAIDLGQVKEQAGVPASFVSASITLQYSEVGGALMARVFGSSPDRTYGFYWALQPSAGRSYEESFWTTKGNWMPLLTVGNFGATTDKITIELTSNEGKFTLPPFSLQPSESRTINVRDLLNTARPFPAGTDFGGFRVYGASSEGQLIVKEHLVDPVMKLATPFYGSYTYVLNAFFYETTAQLQSGGVSSFTAAVGSWYYLGMGAYFSDGTYNGICPYSTSSNNPSIATLTFSGCTETLSGVQVGSTGILARSNQPIDPVGDIGEVDTEQTTVQVVCATPTNYRQTSGYDSGDGTLHFDYAWDSTSGRLTDLVACMVREYVTYPGGNPYSYPSPPFPAITGQRNPDTPSVAAVIGSGHDDHTTPGTFVTPFTVGDTTMTVTQSYQYICPCANGGNPVQLYPAIPGIINIVRTVSAGGSTIGTFTITKSGGNSSGGAYQGSREMGSWRLR